MKTHNELCINCLRNKLLFNVDMLKEKIIISDKENMLALNLSKTNVKKSSGRVDINDLLARVRDEKNKENKLNFIFFGIFAALILIVGTILTF